MQRKANRKEDEHKRGDKKSEEIQRDGVRGWGEYFTLNGSLNQRYYNQRNQIINMLEPGTLHHVIVPSLSLSVSLLLHTQTHVYAHNAHTIL